MACDSGCTIINNSRSCYLYPVDSVAGLWPPAEISKVTLKKISVSPGSKIFEEKES